MLQDATAMRIERPAGVVPQGATWDGHGTSFGLYSEHAVSVELCVFDAQGQRVVSGPLPERRDGVWQGYVAGVGPEHSYGYRVHGLHAPEQGRRFHPQKLLLDPYARAVDRESRFHPAFLPTDDDSAPFAPRARIVDPTFAWDDDAPPQTAWRDTVIYECHVKGLTKLHPEVEPAQRGTYLGLASEPVLAHLQSLGITAVQLLPVQQSFSERFLVERNLSNYWGYNTVGWFAPDIRYACDRTGAAQVREFKTMVRALHRAGIEVLLDVVYNHSGEADAEGPVLSLRGIDNVVYYRADAGAGFRYVDTTGCGNSLRFEHPQPRRLVLDSLRYWVQQMHVDGFRFDLAPTLARTSDGLDVRAGLLAEISRDPVLSKVKLIVEPWDVGHDGHRTGGFAPPYAEWNDRYRDCVRRFWRGSSHGVGELATRLAGSADLFNHSERSPLASVNFITSHDGFSLEDLLSFDRKHNEGNGWDNRDGADYEHSTNFGVEGPSADAHIAALREQAARAMIATLACSAGVPMLRQGDELGQSQLGNNNAYCQDNELSWVSWTLDSPKRARMELVRRALQARRRCAEARRSAFYTGAVHDGEKDVSWHRQDGGELSEADWNDGGRRVLVMRIASPQDGALGTVCLLVNGGAEAVDVCLPVSEAVDTVEVLLDSSDSWPPTVKAHASLSLRGRSVVLVRASARCASTDGGSTALHTLAERMGVVSMYYGFAGHAVHTSDDTRVALLAAMGVDAATDASCNQAIERLEDEAHAPGMDAARVARLGSAALSEIRLRARGTRGTRVHCAAQLVREDGAVLTHEAHTTLHSDELVLNFPALRGLPMGRHELRVQARGGADFDTRQVLFVAPEACVDPMTALHGEHGFGITAHLYALRGTRGFGIGDIGDLRDLATLAGRAGAAFVGHNPLHAVDNFSSPVSPYFPLSRIFGNPIYIDVGSVPELATCIEARTLLASSQMVSERAALQRAERLDYARIARAKRGVLEWLHREFLRTHLGSDNARARAYRTYVARHGRALRDFAVFHALGDVLGGAGSPMLDAARLPAEFRDPRSEAVNAFAFAQQERVALHMFMQFELDRQLAECQAHARSNGLGLGLYGDLAVGNAPSGVEVWSRPELFARGVSLGAPPDPFSADGQSWGLLPLNPRAFVRDGYAYFSTLCEASMAHAGILRIDHVMGLLRQFWVPHGAAASGGAYVRFPFHELLGIASLHSARCATVVVGEDLGVVPDGFRERMRARNILRSQVLHFERDPDGGFSSPTRYAKHSLATVNTHDLPPLVGHFIGRDLQARRAAGQLRSDEEFQRAQEQRAAENAALLVRLREDGCIADGEDPVERSQDLVVAVHRLLARSGSVLLGVAVDDLCEEVDALNIPGLDAPERPSWTRRTRVTMDDLLQSDFARRVLSVLARESR